jgi:hypothetical protein
MISTLVVVVAFVAANEPRSSDADEFSSRPIGPRPFTPALPELVKIPSAACKIPVIWLRPDEVAIVQAYVSDDCGRTWVLDREITRGQDSFVFRAKRPGEYWFASRVKKKDGTFDPADTKSLLPDQRVLFESEIKPPVTAPIAERRLTAPRSETVAPAPIAAPMPHVPGTR